MTPGTQSRGLSFAATFGLALWIGGCADDGLDRAPRLEQPNNVQTYNVVMVSIDTLRADHLGCYGYHLNTSPSIDAFRADAVLFRQAQSHAPATLSSHASIFTSLLHYHHGASHLNNLPLSPLAVTLTEVLRGHGYQTAAFTDGGQLHPDFGLDQGFGVYEVYAGRFRDNVRAAINWLDDREPGPFFLFLHSYEVHHPYTPDKARLQLFDAGYGGPLPDETPVKELLEKVNRKEMDIDAEDLAHIVHTYDAEIHSADEAFGEFLDVLKETGLYDETMIVFTSDHGEEFGEHVRVGWHSHTLYEELLHVPLLVKLPFSKHGGSDIKSVVRSIDIAPTVLSVLGLEAPETFDGLSLLPLLDRPGPDLAVVSQRDMPVGIESTSIRVGKWKLYDGRLFNLDRDAQERVDVAAQHPVVVWKLKRQLRRILSARQPFSAESIEPDDETVDRLRALGYLE